MACGWAMMISTASLHFGASVAPPHATHDLIEGSGVFGPSFCCEEQKHLSHVSGSYSMHDANKWALADFQTYPVVKIDVPTIDNCTLNVECRVVGTHSPGSHTVFIGEVVWSKYDRGARPLIDHAGKYWRLGAQVPRANSSLRGCKARRR